MPISPPTVTECTGCSELVLIQELDDDELCEACADQKHIDDETHARDMRAEEAVNRIRGKE